MFRVAILDDYQHVAHCLADWTSLAPRAQVEFFHDNLVDLPQLASRLQSFQAVVLMRERTPFPRALVEQLPNLRLLVTAGMRNASIDVDAASERGVLVTGTETLPTPTAELTWGLILALSRNLVHEANGMRTGRWQTTVGHGVAGKTLGVLGLGKLGSRVAALGKAFGMQVLAWSQNLTPEKASEAGAVYASKEKLLETQRHRHHPPGAFGAHAQSDWRLRAGAHEAQRFPGQHFARTDREPGGSAGSAGYAPYRRRGHRRL